jgi:hypothetical protein
MICGFGATHFLDSDTSLESSQTAYDVSVKNVGSTPFWINLNRFVAT